MYNWEFPSANNTGTYGLRSYQETFKDNPMLSLAKEICQNSLDAVDDESKPVIVEFNYFNAKRESFPGVEDFLDVLRSCEYYNGSTFKNNDAKEFYTDAISVLEDDEFPCLRISDFNTKGLNGSNLNDNSDWHNLVKSVGVSDKGDGKGGSFGHGKFATFACSHLQTVFYSTHSKDGCKVSQGVARLSSFYNDDNDKTLGIGFYGKSNCNKMDQTFNIDDGFYRESMKYGTDLYIMGFNDTIENWKEKIVASVIDTFYVAILKNKLIVRIGYSLEINSDTIKELIYSEKYKGFLNENTLFNFNAFNSEKSSIFKASIITDNDMEFYFEKNDNPESLNRIAIFRSNGMKIFDQDRNPKAPYYGGTLLIVNKSTDAYFRKLENPQHDKWSAGRSKNVEEANARIRAIRKFIRDCVNKFVEDNRPKAIDVNGLGEFLPDDINIDASESNNSENLPEVKNKKVEIKKAPTSNKKTASSNEIEDETKEILAEILIEDENGDETLNGYINNNTDGPNPNPNPIRNEVVHARKEYIPLKGTKNGMFYANGYYNLVFDIYEEVEAIKLELSISGETIESKSLNVYDVKTPGFFGKKGISFDNNIIEITKINQNKNFKLQFKIDSDEIWPIEVKYYVVKK